MTNTTPSRPQGANEPGAQDLTGQSTAGTTGQHEEPKGARGEPPAGGGTGTTGGLTTEDLRGGFGITGGPGVIGENDDTRGISGNTSNSSATGG